MWLCPTDDRLKNLKSSSNEDHSISYTEALSGEVTQTKQGFVLREEAFANFEKALAHVHRTDIRASCHSGIRVICCYTTVSIISKSVTAQAEICSTFHQMIMLFSGFVSAKIMFPLTQRKKKIELRETRSMILGCVPLTTSVGLRYPLLMWNV